MILRFSSHGFQHYFHVAVSLLLVALGTGATSADNIRPGIGLWYTAGWTQDDRFQHWSHCHRLPLRGKYTAGDPAIIAGHYAEFRELGVDFLIMDDTNGVGNDGGRINDNIRAWFDFMDTKPAAERIPICIGGGGEMRAEGKTGRSARPIFIGHRGHSGPAIFGSKANRCCWSIRIKITGREISRMSGSPCVGLTTGTIMRP